MLHSSSGQWSSGRAFSTDTSNDQNRVDEPFKVEEAETVKAPPPPSDKVLLHFDLMWLLFLFKL